MNWGKTRKVLFYVALLPGLLFAWIAVSLLFSLSHMYYWSGCDFDLPNGAGKIVYEQILIHPMMPEFDRRLIIHNSKWKGKIVDLPMDTCGIDEINVYIYNDGAHDIKYVRMQDASDEYVFDMDKCLLYIITRAGGKTFISEYYKDGDYPGTGTWTDSDGNSGVDVSCNGKPSPEFSGYFATEPGVYFGRIHGGRSPEFIPAREEKEMKIDYLDGNHRKAPWQ